MATFTPILEEAQRLSSYEEKNNILRYILHAFQQKKVKITAGDKKELADFAFGEVKALMDLIPTVESYRKKDEIFAYEDNLLGLIMLCHGSPMEIGADHLQDIQTLMELVNKERFVENAVDNIFKEGQNDKVAVAQLISAVNALKDEYHKGMVYQGLLHYTKEIESLPADSKALFARHLNSELKRYLETPLDDVIVSVLELLCDAVQYFMEESTDPLLYEILKLGKNNISHFAVATLVAAKRSVPPEAVEALAKDLEYAHMTYGLLRKYGMTSLFPAKYADKEYLAKSDLVHWLTYPTELGRVPDEIEFLGVVDKKGEDYYVFRYTSQSDTLGDELKGRWLIGWANDEGGTFSNFNLYEEYEGKNLEKTLKNIKKKLL